MELLVLGCLLVTFGGVLPGVFEANPYPDAVNGSLVDASDRGKCLCDGRDPGGARLARRPRAIVAVLVASLAVSFALQDHPLLLNLRLYAFFLMGMALYAYRDRIVLSWPLALVALGAWVISFNTPVLVLVSATALPYVAMVLAYRTPRSWRRIVAFGDVSIRSLHLRVSGAAGRGVAARQPGLTPGDLRHLDADRLAAWPCFMAHRGTAGAASKARSTNRGRAIAPMAFGQHERGRRPSPHAHADDHATGTSTWSSIHVARRVMPSLSDHAGRQPSVRSASVTSAQA